MAAPPSPSIEEIYAESPTINLVVMDEAGTIVSANRCFHRTAGLPAGSAPGRWFPELLHGLREGERRDWLERRLRSLQGLTAEEAWTREDGTPVPVRQTCIPVETADGRRLYCWGRDISEERFIAQRAAEASFQNRALAEGILALSLCHSEEDLMQVLLGRAGVILDCPHWTVGRVLPGSPPREVELLAFTPALHARFMDAIQGMHLPILDSPFSRVLYREKQLSFVRDSQAEPQHLNPQFVETFGVRSFLGVPLLVDGQVLGALFGVAFLTEPALEPTEAQFSSLQNLARVASLAWNRLTAQKQLQAQVARAEQLNRQLLDFQAAATEVAQDQDFDRLLQVLMEMVAAAPSIDACELYRLDPERRVLERLAHTGLPPGILELYPELPLEGEGRALSGEAAARGETIIVPDIQAFPRAEPAKLRLFQAGLHSSVSIPLKSHKGAVLGAFTVISRVAGPPSPEGLAQMEYFASLAAMALERVDLDARLQRELAQRTQSEALYRTLVEESLQGVYLIQDGVFRYTSPALEELCGYPPGAGRGLPVRDVIHPDDLPVVMENMRRRVEGEVETIRSVFRVVRRDGTAIPVEVQGSRVELEGRPAILGVTQDLRHHLAAQEALQRSVERARLLAESAQAFSLAGSRDDLLQALFQGARNLTGIPHWWYNRFDPVQRASLTIAWSPELSERFTAEEIQAPIPLDEYPMREDVHLNRATIWIEDCKEVPEFPPAYLARVPHRSLVAVPMVQGGEAVGALFGGTFGDEAVLALSQDQLGTLQSLSTTAGLALSRLEALSEVAAREAEYRQLFDQAAEAILIGEVDGTWVMANDAACALFGYAREEILGQRAGFSSPEIQPDGRPSREVLDDFARMGREGRSGGFEFTSYRKDGSLVHTELSVAPLRKDGRTMVQVVLRDRTGARRAAQEKEALERQLFEAQKLESLGAMASGIAHDFNNLLMGVLGHAGVVLEELGPDHPLARHLQSIQASANRASDLTRQLMAYTGRGRFHHDQLDLGMEVRECLQLLEKTLPPAVVLDLDLAPDLPVIEGDHVQVQQVLANLLLNAAEALGAGGGRVRVATSAGALSEGELADFAEGRGLAPGVYVRLEVGDTGPGMDEATLARIFEPFYTTKFQGRGLGLPAVLGIVRGHGGGVRVRSAPGEGTLVQVVLPAAEGSRDRSAAL
ncbi:MAG: PAS domain S-box protein [Holophagaceae bacterium]